MNLASGINDVFSILDDLIAEALSTGSKIGLFAAVFRQTALKVFGAIEQREFADSVRMEQLMVRLANRYFQALYGYQSGTSITKSWELAFLATQRTDLIVIQHLLLAGNAHINLDLAVATSETVVFEHLNNFASDFRKINLILTEVFDSVQEVIDKNFSLMKLIDEVGQTYDEMLMNFSIEKARSIAWKNAQLLASQSPSQQIKTIQVIDRKTRFLGQVIISPSQLFGKLMNSLEEEQEYVIAILDALKAQEITTQTVKNQSPSILSLGKDSKEK